MLKRSPVASGDPAEVAIIGAGPYGLSIAAHLHARRTPFRIFGTPMHSWRYRMPEGMCLKSDGFASDLFDPAATLTLAQYSKEKGLPYMDVGYPIPIETFISYGLEFQRRFVPQLESSDVTTVKAVSGGFALTTSEGEVLTARKVVVAVGISHFAYLPPLLAGLPQEFVTHSSAHRDMSTFRGKRVAVIGGGSSAVDIAALMHEKGVGVELIARRADIQIHSPPVEPRPRLQQMINPRSGLGLGWRSRLCTDAPLLFHAMPERFRLRAVKNHLGPSSGWFIREKVVGKVPFHLGVSFKEAVVRGDKINLSFTQQDGKDALLAVDHVVAGTGYRVSLQRLSFLDSGLRATLRSVDDTPILKTNFESSAKGLYFVGLASANCFGPLTRFAFGAGFTSKRITPFLAAP